MVQEQRWHLAGSAPEVYERYLVPAVFGRWAPILVDVAARRPGSRVLDVACGTGVVARHAKPKVGPTGTVTGLDLNPGMLTIARSLDPSIDWQEGNAEALPFADGSFEVVFCQLGLQYFRDRSASLREMRRALARGGRLVVLVWRPIQYSPGFAILADALERHLSVEVANIMRAPFSLDDPEQLRSLIAAAGLGDVEIRPSVGTVRFASPNDFLRYYVAGSPLAGPVGQAEDRARRALMQDASTALQAFVCADGLAFPIEGNVATALG
jgi:ubiquinone/menaquinone biosynthesis C-methylase UbiE